MSVIQKSAARPEEAPNGTSAPRRQAGTEATKPPRAVDMLDKIHREAVDLARRAAETRARMT
jgi:hypothetical protein